MICVDNVSKALTSQKKRSYQTNALMLSGNFKEAALGNMNGGGINVNGKGVATSSDYIQTSIGMMQPPFYT